MAAYDESTGALVIWMLLFPFVLLEYLNTYILYFLQIF